MPAGRPTKYQPEFCDTVRQVMSEGLSKEAAAGAIGVSIQTIYTWMQEHPEFLEAIKDGEAKSMAVWEKIGLDGASGRISNFSASAYIFNMKNRFRKYGWNDTQTIAGDPENPLKTEANITLSPSDAYLRMIDA